MTSESNQVTCEQHGTCEAAFVCQHLAQGEKRGVNLGYDPDDPDALYPDAWCDDCERVLDEAGEWNEESEAFAGIKLVCARCYEGIRDRNWIEDEKAFHDLVCSSHEAIEPKQQAFISQYKVDQFERWDWDQETASLIFSHEGKPRVEATVQFSGTYSKNSESWMWAWANTSLHENVKSSSRQIRDLGEAQGYRQLVSGRWSGSEVDAWEMTTVMARELDAIGVYRTPSDYGFVYMVIIEARWVSEQAGDGRS